MLHTMPEPLDSEFMALFQQVGLLKLKFHEFETLFADVSVLNQVAPRLFSVVHHAMWADLVMHLARVTGPRSGFIKGKSVPNLTIRRLPDLVAPEMKGDVTAKVDAAVEAAEFTTQVRNKIYAHHDLETALSSDACGITAGSRALMDRAIGDLDAALRAVFEPHSIIPLSHHIPANEGGADTLVAVLRERNRA